MPNGRDKLSVLFVCTGNTCRSQMAEALLRRLAGDGYNALSAGTSPGLRVHPYAVSVLAELVICVEDQHPKSLDEFDDRNDIDYAIFVCSGAAEACPNYSGARERLYWPFEDPSEFVGASDEETLAKYREVRDLISARIAEWLANAG